MPDRGRERLCAVGQQVRLEWLEVWHANSTHCALESRCKASGTAQLMKRGQHLGGVNPLACTLHFVRAPPLIEGGNPKA
jgi:hypothetical protein